MLYTCMFIYVLIKSYHQVILLARFTFRPWCKPWHLWCLAAKTRGTSNTHHLDTSAPTQCVATLVETPAICTIHSRFAAPPERWRDFLKNETSERQTKAEKNWTFLRKTKLPRNSRNKKWDCFCVVVSPHKTIKTLQRWIVWKPTIPSLKRNWPWIKVINLCHYATSSFTIIWVTHPTFLPPARRCKSALPMPSFVLRAQSHLQIVVLTKHWNR